MESLISKRRRLFNDSRIESFVRDPDSSKIMKLNTSAAYNASASSFLDEIDSR